MELIAAILHYCKYQERCHSDVRNKLYELGFSTSEVEEQIANLIETGILNEERYARAFARGKFRMKQWGKEKIKQQLKAKKISDYCINKGLMEIDQEEYDQTLQKISARKLEEIKNDRSEWSRKSKLYRFLIQKGYEKDIVTDIVNNSIKKHKE